MENSKRKWKEIWTKVITKHAPWLCQTCKNQFISKFSYVSPMCDAANISVSSYLVQPPSLTFLGHVTFIVAEYKRKRRSHPQAFFLLLLRISSKRHAVSVRRFSRRLNPGFFPSECRAEVLSLS